MWTLTKTNEQFSTLRSAVEHILTEFMKGESKSYELTAEIIHDSNKLLPVYRVIYVNLRDGKLMYDWPFTRVEDTNDKSTWSISIAGAMVRGYEEKA